MGCLCFCVEMKVYYYYKKKQTTLNFLFNFLLAAFDTLCRSLQPILCFVRSWGCAEGGISNRRPESSVTVPESKVWVQAAHRQHVADEKHRGAPLRPQDGVAAAPSQVVMAPVPRSLVSWVLLSPESHAAGVPSACTSGVLCAASSGGWMGLGSLV